MLAAVFPFGAVANDTKSVEIAFSAQSEGEFLFPRQTLTVYDGTAEKYGYEVSLKDHNQSTVESPTVFDAFVAAHEAKYGESFTAETAKTYLEISSSGMITKAFGKAASNSGFLVNGGMPADDNGISYLADTARLKDDDSVEFWIYQDAGWLDYYTAFSETEKIVGVGEDFSLKLTGFSVYSLMMNPSTAPSAIDGTNENTYLTINLLNTDGTLGEAVTDADKAPIAPNADGEISLKFDKAGTYFVTANGFANDATNGPVPIIAPFCKVTVADAPEAINIVCENAFNPSGNILVAKTGDKLKFKAVDQNGNETPVKWSTTSSWSGTMDAKKGIFEITASLSASGGTTYLYISAESLIDPSIKKDKARFDLKGYTFPESTYSPKDKTVELSTDGQTKKTLSLSGGYDGNTVWNFVGMEEIAKLSAGQSADTKSNKITLDILRPGKFTVSFKLDCDDSLNDTATVTVKGVAVEDGNKNQTKTYITKTSENPTPQVQLYAYTEDNKNIKSWSSSDENVATVDENGKVTAVSVGSAIITATDSEGAKGGIKVVVRDGEKPYFEELQFLANAIENYATTYSFSPTKTEYDLKIKQYSTTKLTLQGTTLFDTDKFSATASYKNINGENETVKINSGAITYLDGIPFEKSVVKITLADKDDPTNRTVYTFNVERPRDETKQIKNYTGITVTPDGKNINSSVLYKTKAEGTLFKADENGEPTKSGTNYQTGVTSTHYVYKTYILNQTESFYLNLASSTNYAHIRYSLDEGKKWTEIAQGGGTTDKIAFENKNAKITVQIIGDKAYTQSKANGGDGFDSAEPTVYTIYAEQADGKTDDVQILTATSDVGDWYPEFSKDLNSFTLVTPNGTIKSTLKYTVSDGATVTLGGKAQTPDESGVYTLNLTTSLQTLTLTSKSHDYANTYSFKILQKSKYAVPDKITDFLCINSQYTNGIGAGNGASPQVSLGDSSFTSLGNFGGYITYYYEKGITNDPKNKFGIDFYVYGNSNVSSTSDKYSFFEPGQVWVSEDGEKWYALAGSAHYDDGVEWDYKVTYTKTASGKTAWVDNKGNSNDGTSSSGQWVIPERYTLNQQAKSDTITLSGICLPAADGSIALKGTSLSAYPVCWGYADALPNGTLGADANPYIENSALKNPTSGFDLEWAVDEKGMPIDVSDKDFHYIKVQTASNIWHSLFGEKSTEVASVIRTTAQTANVGRTDLPAGVTISDGAESKIINFTEGQQVYTADLGDMKYVSIGVNGAGSDDNIYVNNTRILPTQKAEGFKIIGEKTVRIVVQNGDKEPAIVLLNLKSNAKETDSLIENIKITVSGVSRNVATNDGKTFTDSVGYRIDSIGIVPIVQSGAEIKVNGEAPKETYSLSAGVNTFEISVQKGDIKETATLNITKAAAPASTGQIKVHITVLGDEKHGDNGEVHTKKSNNLTTWIKRTTVTADSTATVLDVLESVLKNVYTYTNADRNYISEINGLKEFDNGPNSGWMYTVNGIYPDLGVAEKTVSSGDVIIFHYTDDYTIEHASDKFQSSASSKNDVKDDSKGEDKDTENNTPEESGFSKFRDVKPVDWFFEAVKFAYENNLIKGITESEFAPEEKMTRSMLVTILYRLENEPEAKTFVFSDIENGEWYENAVAWAYENNIVSGISDNEFDPSGNITREQIATILLRYANYKGIKLEGTDTDLSAYKDLGDISDFAKEAFKWAVKTGIINGTTDGKTLPRGFASRAEAAVMLMRFIKAMK